MVDVIELPKRLPDSAPQVVRLPCCAAPPADPTRCPDVLCRARREAMGRAPVVRVIEIQQGAPVNA
jgi:hypothetical protein